MQPQPRKAGFFELDNIHKKQYTATKIPFMYSFSGNCAAPQSQFPDSYVCERFIFPGNVHIFSCSKKKSRIGRSIVGIYKSLTDTWMWKLGLWPRNSFSGNMCFEFSVLIFCRVGTVLLWTQQVQDKMNEMHSFYLCMALEMPCRYLWE